MGVFCPVCLCGTHYLWPGSAIPVGSRLPPLRSGSSWLGLFLRMDRTSFQLQSLPEAGKSTDIRYCRVVGLLYCNLVATTPKLVGRRGWTIVQHAPCPATWWKDTACHLAGMGHGTAFRLAQRCWLSPASYVCHIGPWSGEDLWHHAGCKWLPWGSIKQKRRVGAEASFSFSIQQSWSPEWR